MRIGIVILSFDLYVDPLVFRRLVGEVEALGFDSAWFGDHVVFPRDNNAHGAVLPGEAASR